MSSVSCADDDDNITRRNRPGAHTAVVLYTRQKHPFRSQRDMGMKGSWRERLQGGGGWLA